jgi:hypothetical protein
MNRLPYHIKGLRSIKEQSNLISYLKEHPAFNKFEAKIHHDIPTPGSISATLTLSYFHQMFYYKNYILYVSAVLGEIYITCEKLNHVE